MALTIRKLSEKAEKNLKEIQEKSYYKSASKGIEHALEMYSINEEKITYQKNQINNLNWELQKALGELESITRALKVVNNFTIKKK